MKKVFAFLAMACFVAANLVVMAQASVTSIIEEDGGKVTCYSVITHRGDKDIVKCYGCQNVMDASSYSGSDKCKP